MKRNERELVFTIWNELVVLLTETKENGANGMEEGDGNTRDMVYTAH